MARRNKEIADVKRSYPINIRIGMIGALLIAIGLFAFAPTEFEVKPYQTDKKDKIISEEIELEVEDLVKPPPETKPATPVEAESEEEIEAETTAETEWADVYSKPEEAVEVKTVEFWKVEKKPKPKHSPQPEYPQQARTAEMEGQVIVEALVGVDGSIEQVRLLKSSGFDILDNSAVAAARNWRFTPAEQRDKPVKVWVKIPFTFRLTT